MVEVFVHIRVYHVICMICYSLQGIQVRQASATQSLAECESTRFKSLGNTLPQLRTNTLIKNKIKACNSYTSGLTII